MYTMRMHTKGMSTITPNIHASALHVETDWNCLIYGSEKVMGTSLWLRSETV